MKKMKKKTVNGGVNNTIKDYLMPPFLKKVIINKKVRNLF